MREGWRIVKLDEIISFERGLTYAKGDEVAHSSVGVLRSNNVDLTTQSLNLDEIKYLREDFEVPEKKKVRKSSLLMCMSNGSKDHLGKVALIDEDLGYAFGGFMGLLTPDETKVVPKYLYYALASKSFKDYIHGLADGANINNLKYKDLAAYDILLLPLAEQQRIVDILDREFAKIDALKANAEKSLQAAKDLFQATLKKELEPKEGWHNTSLHSICKSLFAGGDAPKGKISKIKTEEYSIPILSNGIGENAIYGYTTDARVFDKAITISARGTIGYVALRESPFFPIVRLIVAIPGDDVLAEYLKHYLTTISFRSDGTAIPQLTIPMIKDFVVTYPSKEKQRSIVSLLNDLNDRCKSLQDNYQKTLTLCDDLKQSLLRKAFNGEL